ncbi:hypothetical protein [Streptomyces longwoodensis]|uniref:hypothetical protein n=1 Tax=Streptomyces longwoodensis TaxID=68231 RepID=UPI0036F9DD10
MGGPIGLDVLLARVGIPGTDYSNRVARLESMIRVGVSDLERLLRLAAREHGASEEDLEERVGIIAGAVVRMAAQRAVDAHRSAVRRARPAAPGGTPSA